MFKRLINTKGLTSDKWLEVRKTGIGGSDVPYIMGISKYSTINDLWLNKTGRVVNHVKMNESMYWGTVLEPIIIREFEKRTGIEVQREDYILQNNKHKFMIANLDGICEVEGQKCIFEAKTANYKKREQWENGIPQEYNLQIQHYMSVTGFKKVFIAVLIGGNNFKWYEIKRDNRLIDEMIDKEMKFWHCVTKDIQPYYYF